MLENVVDAGRYRLRENFVGRDLTHACRVLHAHLVVKLRQFRHGLHGIYFTDVVVAHAVGLGQRHSAFYAHPRDKRSRDREMVLHVAKRVF